MTDDLKPCPFCGWDVPYVRTTGTETEVYCQSCTAVGPLVASNTPEENVDSEATRLWNRRANTATIKAAVDMMADQHGWVRTNSEWNAAIRAAADAATYIIQNIEILKPDGETYETPRVQKLARGLVDLARQDILALLKEKNK